MQNATTSGKKRVLLVSYYFPPCNMVASLRTYSFARYLARAGHAVTVLAADFSGSGLDQTLQLDCTGFEVVRVSGGGGSLKNIDHYGQRALAAEDSSRFGLAFLSTLFRQAARLKNACLGNFLIPEDLWFPKALARGRKLLDERKYHVLLSSQGPITAHLIGLWLKKARPDLFWIADYRDPWSNSANFQAPKWPFSSLQCAMEAGINSQADHITTVSAPLVDDYFAAYRHKSTVIENGYFPEECAATGCAAPEHAAAQGGFICAHTGTFYFGSYDAEPLWQAVAALFQEGAFSSDSFRLRFYGNNAYQMAKPGQDELDKTLELFRGVPRAQSLAVQRMSQALLFFSSDHKRYRGVFSSKIFEYLVSGTPIIVIGNGEGNCAAELVRAAGAGFVCGNDVQKIIDAFKRIASGDLPQRNDDVIAAFSRERLADRLIALVESGAGFPRPGENR